MRGKRIFSGNETDSPCRIRRQGEFFGGGGLVSVELILNVAILAFSIFCYWFVGATTPPSSMPGIMSAADWPRLILIGLVIALSINIVKLLRESKKNAGAEAKKWRELFPPRFIVAFVILVAYSIILEYLGFLPSTFLFVMAFSALIGLRKISHLVLGALCSSVAIYVIFQILLQVLLPRGMGVFREFSIFLEGLF